MAQLPPETPVNPYSESTKHLVPKRTGPDREGAKSKLAGPAGGLLLTSIFTIVLAAGSSLFVLTMMGITVVFAEDEQESSIRVSRPDEDSNELSKEEKKAQKKMEQGAQFLNVAIIMIVSLVVIFLNTVILIGAVKMKKLESYAFASIATRLAIVPIISPLIVLGMPFGIWGVAVLSDKKVRAAFDK